METVQSGPHQTVSFFIDMFARPLFGVFIIDYLIILLFKLTFKRKGRGGEDRQVGHASSSHVQLCFFFLFTSQTFPLQSSARYHRILGITKLKLISETMLGLSTLNSLGCKPIMECICKS